MVSLQQRLAIVLMQTNIINKLLLPSIQNLQIPKIPMLKFLIIFLKHLLLLGHNGLNPLLHFRMLSQQPIFLLLAIHLVSSLYGFLSRYGLFVKWRDSYLIIIGFFCCLEFCVPKLYCCWFMAFEFGLVWFLFLFCFLGELFSFSL